MRSEKKQISAEYAERLETSPYFIAIDYQGLTVEAFTELRGRLRQVQSEVHVVKNTIFAIAAAEAGYENLADSLRGQVAVVTGSGEISAAAKVIKNFAAEFDRPGLHFGFMGQEHLDAEGVERIADLPSLDGLRSMVIGLIQTPARSLATIVQLPARQLAQVIRAGRVEGQSLG